MTARLFPLLLLLPAWLAAGVPAFPGAEGFGAETPGGRGGRVLFVTTLNDSGPGSLRQAVTASGPRTVMFRVGGLIDLKTPLVITEPFLTIAGQSAPGDGICLRGYPLVIRSHDIVVRFLRSRLGDETRQETDAISIVGDSRNVILDHCSASWSVDEALSPSGALSNITLQWCIIAEALNHSVHKKGDHGYGSLVRAVGGVSLHHNLWAHNTARNPRLGDNYGRGVPTYDFRNNVIYDYGEICSGMTGDRLHTNYVANYIKRGPSSRDGRKLIVFTKTAETQYYIADNVVEGDAARTADNAKMFDRTEIDGRKLVTVVPTPFDAPVVSIRPAAEAREAVLKLAGAVQPRRDAVDARIVSEVRSGTGHIIDTQKQVGGWPEYRSGASPADRDDDGIPDAWEKKHKLNPQDAADGNALRPDGYTNLEAYLNELAAGAK